MAVVSFTIQFFGPTAKAVVRMQKDDEAGLG